MEKNQTSDPFARLLAIIGLALGAIGVFSALGGNAPVDLAVVQPKFPGGIDVSSAGSTPGIIINAESTGVPVIKFVNAAGTEVANISSTGAFIGPAHGGTPTP